jgi:hypothetical protein
VALELVRTYVSERTLQLKLTEGPAVLLIAATVISAVSFSFHMMATGKTLGAEVILGYFPVLLGFVAMLLCIWAGRKSTHKGLVALYAVVLAPFAFSYPAWMVILWVLYVSGRYKGPMP